MAISTLNEYYQSKGQALPSVSERQGIAAQAGIQNYTGTAQQNTQLLGNLMSTGANNQVATPSTPIPAQVATGTTTPVDLPNRPQPQAPTDVYAQASGYLGALPKTGVAGLDQITQAMVERPGQLAQQYDIANKQSLMQEAKNKLDAFNEQYRVQQERIRSEGGRSLEQINSEVNAIERTRAFTAGTLAIEAAYRTGDFQGAKELMNQQIQLELEPMKMKYQFFKDLYDRTEDQKFQRAMRAEERAYQAAKDAANRKQNLIEKAIDNGVYSSDMKNMSYDQIAERLGNAVAQSGDFAATLDTTASLEPATLQKSTKQQLAQLIATGDYKGAITRIQNSVSKGLTGENKTNFDGKRTALPAIDSLANKLQAYADAGGDTGILKGNVEDISAKLGKVNDPKFKQLATDLKISLQAYRQSVSGAAFSPQEAKEYASVNPSGNKSLNLNLSIINGMRDNFERQVSGTVDAVVGDGAKYIREYASYQGLPKEDAIVKYVSDNPDKKQIVSEMMNVPGATIDMIAQTLGIDKLIQ